jgi:hypothetical protein
MLVDLCRNKASRYLIEREIIAKRNLNTKDSCGITALMYTCRNNDYLHFSQLLKAGAEIYIKDRKYRSVQIYACRKKDSRYVKLLLQYTKSFRFDSFRVACKHNRKEIMDILVKYNVHSYSCHHTLLAMLKTYPTKLLRKEIIIALNKSRERKDVEAIYNIIKIYCPILPEERKMCDFMCPKISKYMQRDKAMKEILPKYLIPDILNHIVYRYTNFIQFSDSNMPVRRFMVNGQYIYHDREDKIKEYYKHQKKLLLKHYCYDSYSNCTYPDRCLNNFNPNRRYHYNGYSYCNLLYRNLLDRNLLNLLDRNQLGFLNWVNIFFFS